MSDYKEKIDNMVWSYSRLSSYEQCAYDFYLKYLLQLFSEYLPENNYYAEIGSYVHLILEKVLKGELKQEEAIHYFVNNYDDHIFYKTKESIMDNSFEMCAAYLRELDFNWLKDFDIIGVEQKISTVIEDENGKGYQFTGYIDLAIQNKDDGEIYVIDHKSAAYPLKADGKTILKKHLHTFESYKRQLYLYSKYIFEKYGKFPKMLMWNHFKDQKINAIPFNEAEYNQAIRWFLDTIHKIEKDETYEPNYDYFFCNHICEFRDSCEYNEVRN